MRVEMNVQTRIHHDAGFVLHIGQYIAQVVCPVVVQKTDDADDFLVTSADLLLDEVVTNQVADRLGAILIPLSADAFIERFEEIVFQRNAEARQL
jgi:hypothetical protein